MRDSDSSHKYTLTRQQATGTNFKNGKFYLKFYLRVVKHKHNFSREAVESPSVDMFKTQQDTVLDNLLQ